MYYGGDITKHDKTVDETNKQQYSTQSSIHAHTETT